MACCANTWKRRALDLRNSMLQEYQFNLKLVEDGLSGLEDKGLQARIAQFVNSQRGNPA